MLEIFASVIGRVASYRRSEVTLVDMFLGLANFPSYDFFTSLKEKGRKMCALEAEVWSRFLEWSEETG
jgi:hypothetical protein